MVNVRARRLTFLLIVALVATGRGRDVRAARAHPVFAGTWTLDHDHSQITDDLGFDPGVSTTGSDGRTTTAATGGRGGRVAARPTTAPPALNVGTLSEEDFARGRQLVDEVRMPPATLTIQQTDDVVTITDDHGHTRTFHTNGKEEYQELTDAAVATKAKWSGEDLVVDYAMFQDEQLRYTYSRATESAPLTVHVEFLEKNDKGPHDAVTLVYNRNASPPGPGH